MLYVIFFLSFLIESITEYFVGSVIDIIGNENKPEWYLRLVMYLPKYTACILGVVGACIYKVDLVSSGVAMIGETYQVPEMPILWFGYALTGFIIGRGANIFHGVISWIAGLKGMFK